MKNIFRRLFNLAKKVEEHDEYIAAQKSKTYRETFETLKKNDREAWEKEYPQKFKYGDLVTIIKRIRSPYSCFEATHDDHKSEMQPLYSGKIIALLKVHESLGLTSNCLYRKAEVHFLFDREYTIDTGDMKPHTAMESLIVLNDNISNTEK
jgi:hypothetical protein